MLRRCDVDRGGPGQPGPRLDNLPGAAQPSPRETNGAARANIGNCLNIYKLPGFNTGGPGQSTSPEMVTATERVPCEPGSYEVLQRFTATNDRNRCQSVPGTDSAYTSDDPKSTSADFILCLRKREVRETHWW